VEDSFTVGKNFSDKKWEGSKAWKALNFKKWGLKPRSLTPMGLGNWAYAWW